MLTDAEVEAINAKFNLDLDYDTAAHFRAAQVIWGLARLKDVTIPAPEADPEGDTRAADPDREGSALSYRARRGGTAD